MEVIEHKEEKIERNDRGGMRKKKKEFIVIVAEEMLLLDFHVPLIQPDRLPHHAPK